MGVPKRRVSHARQGDRRAHQALTLPQLEECPHCHQLYAYEIEVRCPACDGPSCPHCVQLVERGIVCVVCRDDREEIEETSGGG